ncbi:MAG: MarR family transcriptional regulator [Candidatus Solibacter sp.]
MAGKLQRELKQSKAIASVAEESLLNIVRTADVLLHSLTMLMKPYQISPTQYNVLRILRGAGEQGVSCKEIAARLVARDPDITRLMDRLEQRELIVRDRAKEDRRIVTHRLTQAGLDLLSDLHRPLEAANRQFTKDLEAADLRKLVDVLEQIRTNL